MLFDFLDFVFRSFWTFIGFAIILGIVVQFLYSLIYNPIQRTLRHRVMMKHGYPPKHCDADGNYPTIEEKQKSL